MAGQDDGYEDGGSGRGPDLSFGTLFLSWHRYRALLGAPGSGN
jgi:hypothetical protein